MCDFIFESHDIRLNSNPKPVVVGGSPAFWAAKRLFDITLSLFLLPVLAFFALGLFVVNPFWNRGPLFFVQSRMGKNCRPFYAVKFRTMMPAAEILRGPEDPIEHERITGLGHLLRRSRIDELPQILNVLMDDMSLIGPRPDYFAHATSYLATIPGYRERHTVRPGISGLAQVSIGYVESTEGVKSKTQADLHYIKNASFGMEAKLVFQTICTVFARVGA